MVKGINQIKLLFSNNSLIIHFFIFRTISLPNFLGTFVQPNLTITNNNNNNNIVNNNNISNSAITVVQTNVGFQKESNDDNHDIPMIVDDVKLQHSQTGINMAPQLVEIATDKSSLSPKNNCIDLIENNNRRTKDEDDRLSPSSSSSFIDINNLPMVFDDTKLFNNVSVLHLL